MPNGTRVTWSDKATGAARRLGTAELVGRVQAIHALDVGTEYLVRWSDGAEGWQPESNLRAVDA